MNERDPGAEREVHGSAGSSESEASSPEPSAASGPHRNDEAEPDTPSFRDTSLRELIKFRLTLAVTKISEWPSVPELASDVLSHLGNLGIDDHDRQQMEMLKPLKKARDETGSGEDLETFDLSTAYYQLVRDRGLCDESGVYPITEHITGERAVLVLGDTTAEDWRKRAPYFDGASSETEDLTAMTAMTLVTATRDVCPDESGRLQ